MKQDLNKLATSLQKIIDFVKENNLVNDLNKKRFETLKKFYEALAKNEIDVAKYDFRDLKRDVSALIHPDRISAKISAKATALMAEFNGAFDDVKKDQKGLKEGEKVYQSTPKKKEGPKKKEEPKKQEPVEEVDPFENFNTYNGGTLKEKVIDLWYLFIDKINKVPRDENDYYKIKYNIESMIEKIKRKIEDKNVALDKVNKEIDELKAKLKDELKPSSIKKAYNAKLKQLLDEYNMAAASRASAMQKFYSMQSGVIYASKEEIQKRVLTMEAELKSDKARFDAICALGSNYDNARYEKTKYTYAEMREILRERLMQFSNRKAVEKYVINDILSKNSEYQEVLKKAQQEHDKYMDAKAKYEDCLENEQDISVDLSADVNKKYRSQINVLIKRRSLICSKRNKLQKKLTEAETKYAEFLAKYQSSYEIVGDIERRAGGSVR